MQQIDQLQQDEAALKTAVANVTNLVTGLRDQLATAIANLQNLQGQTLTAADLAELQAIHDGLAGDLANLSSLTAPTSGGAGGGAAGS